MDNWITRVHLSSFCFTWSIQDLIFDCVEGEHYMSSRLVITKGSTTCVATAVSKTPRVCNCVRYSLRLCGGKRRRIASSFGRVAWPRTTMEKERARPRNIICSWLEQRHCGKKMRFTSLNTWKTPGRYSVVKSFIIPAKFGTYNRAQGTINCCSPHTILDRP